MRIHSRLLSTNSLASNRGIQAESSHGPDPSVYCLWLSGIHQERDYRPTAAPSFHSADLPLGLARAPDLFLDLSQHAVVSVRVLKSAFGLEAGYRPPIHVNVIPGLEGGQ